MLKIDANNIAADKTGAGKTAVRQSIDKTGIIGDQNTRENKPGISSKTSIEKAIEKLNKTMDLTQTERRFEMSSEPKGKTIVKIINKETKEVLRQIPSEEALRISKNIDEMIGLLLDSSI